MKRRPFLLLMAIALAAAMVAPAHGWDQIWTHQFTSTGFIGAYGGSADSAGVYASGGVFGDLPGTTPIGRTDAYVRKVDHAGQVLWTRRVGTTSYDDSQGVAADADGAYIAGLTCGTFPGQVASGGCDAYAAKLSPDGELQWVTQFGTPAFDYPNQYGAIAVHETGVYVTGKTEGAFPGGLSPEGASNTFLARLDSTTGALLWVRQFGRPDPDFFNVGGVGVDETGVAVAHNAITGPDQTANEVRKYAHDGSLLWSKHWDQTATPCGHPIFGLTSHGGHVYVIGQTYEWRLTDCEDQPFGVSYVIGLLQNLDPNGNVVWQRRVKAGVPGRQGGAGIAPFTGAKVVHVTDQGIFIGANVRKLRFAGDVRREPRSDRSVCSDPGASENAIFSGYDGYVRHYGFDGDVIWTHQFGSGLFELVTGLGSYGGRVYAAGLTRCVVEEGADPESGALVDGFITAFAIDPTTSSGHTELIVGQLDTLSDAGRISSGDYQALTGHLESALSALAESRTTTATNALEAFIAAVESHRNAGRLAAQDAQALIAAAADVIDEL